MVREYLKAGDVSEIIVFDRRACRDLDPRNCQGFQTSITPERPKMYFTRRVVSI